MRVHLSNPLLLAALLAAGSAVAQETPPASAAPETASDATEAAPADGEAPAADDGAADPTAADEPAAAEDPPAEDPPPSDAAPAAAPQEEPAAEPPPSTDAAAEPAAADDAPAPAEAAPAAEEAKKDDIAPYGKGAVIKLNDDGSSAIRIITWHQIWARVMDTNPGTVIQNKQMPWHADVALRRSRLLLLGNLGKDLRYLMHVGINNQTFSNLRKPQLYVHDAWVEYDVFGKWLSVGGGLHYWHGISRMTNASTLNFLAMDSPILQWATIERTDQFARNLGVYAKGKAWGFDYRVAVNKPFTTSREVGANADYNPESNTFSAVGYFKYDFLDVESNTLPFAVGTYLGKKRVFNVGAGFHYHPDAMAYLDDAGDTQITHALMVGVDSFLDYPMFGYGALTAYVNYLYYDMGPGHLRNVGIMNPGSGGSTLNGGGNAYPIIGTGHHVYGQMGYLLPSDFLMGLSIQPYVAATASFFDRYDEPSVVVDAGVNWYLVGHHSKLTLHYRNRPIFNTLNDNAVNVSRGNEVILQMAFFL